MGIVRRFLGSLKKWTGNYLSMYILAGLTIINLSLYYLYYSLTPIFVEGLIFLFKITGKEVFPLFGFCLSIIPPIIASYSVFLSARILNPVVRIIIIFVVMILALLLTLTFMPLSITIFVAYISLAGVVTSISFFRSVIERLELPLINDKENRRFALEMRHHLLTIMLAYSIWAIITVVIAGLSALLLNPAVGEMIRAGGLKWLFVQGQTILCIGLIAYYSIGFITGVIMGIIRKLLEVEEVFEKYN